MRLTGSEEEGADALERALLQCGLNPSILRQTNSHQVVLEADGCVRLVEVDDPSKRVERRSVPKREGDTRERKYVCPECGSGFLKRAHLDDHVQMRHRRPTTNEFACDVCDCAFPSRRLLTSHQQVRTIDYRCDYEKKINS
jgi:hypothetical protein